MMNAFLVILPQAAEQGDSTFIGTVYQSILDGGWMMIPIAACSIIALSYFIERMMALAPGRLFPKRFDREIREYLENDELEEASDFCGKEKAPVARILGAGLKRWKDPRPEIEKAVEDAGRREVATLSGNLRPLVVVATVSPLLGLLGTVIGMIKAFGVIAVERGIGKPELLADGISQALVTTAAGLIVAIPAQVGYFFLKAKIDRFTRKVEILYHDAFGSALDRRRKAA